MVVHWYSDLIVPGSQYSHIYRKQKPPGRCRLNGALPNNIDDCRKTRLSDAVRTWQVCKVVQTYKAQSCIFMREVIVQSIDRICNNILRLSSVFWLLTVDSCWYSFLIARTMPSLYSRLHWFVCPYFNAMTTMLMIALSWSHHAPGDNMPCIPVSYRVHTSEVLKHYAADKNQAIQRMISCQTMCQMKLELRHLAIHWASRWNNYES